MELNKFTQPCPNCGGRGTVTSLPCTVQRETNSNAVHTCPVCKGQGETGWPRYIALSMKITLTKEQQKDGYTPGYTDIVYDRIKKEDIGQGSWWRDEETAGRMACERITGIYQRKAWEGIKCKQDG